MSEFSPQSPWLLPGALIVLEDTTIVPIPSMIPFQYNPSTLSRTVDPYQPKSDVPGEGYAVLARSQPGPPTETIALSLELDATDFLEDPGNHPVGSLVGVSSPIASLEKLTYPTGWVVGAVIDAIKGVLGLGGPSTVPRSEVPVVLFFWGPSRIVPVRVTSLTIEEQGHTPLLYPVLATARLSMRVLTPPDFPPQTSIAEKIAIAAYEWTSLNRDLISAAGLVDTVAGIIPD